MATQMLTARQVTERLGVDKSTVYRMADDGRLPAVRIGRQWRFPAEEVAEMLQPDERGPSPHRGGDPLRASAVGTIVDVLAESLGIMMVVTDMDGHPLTPIANPCASLAERLDDPTTVRACAAEWREMAGDPDLAPRFRTGHLGFQCARAFIRSGPRLIGMVLGGGVPAPRGPADGLWDLDETQRSRVLEILPRVAAAFSDLAGHQPAENVVPSRQAFTN
jgi:excisionase family DNA binding protein